MYAWEMTIGELVLTMLASIAFLVIIGAAITIVTTIRDAIFDKWRN